MIDAAKFKSEALRINPTMGRFTKSALDPIFAAIGSHPRTHLDTRQTERVQELIFNLPFSTQTKYAQALQVLKTGGFYICGRPTAPSMHFKRFDQGAYSYVGRTHERKDKMVVLEPGSLHHVFDFKWKSSTGNLQSLASVWTQEHIKFRTSQRNAPFNDVMPPDMQFTWGKTQGAASGFGRDDHSMKPPILVSRFPFVQGWNVAEQWYQYSMNGQDWKNIPGAAYLIHKGIRRSNGKWVFAFKKTNWHPHNKVAYKFEAEYPLGPPLVYQPKPGQKFMRTNGSEADISKFGTLISRA